MHEGDKESLALQRMAQQALDGYINRLRYALRPFALICADDGDDYSSLPDNVIIMTEVTAGELREAREALEAWVAADNAGIGDYMRLAEKASRLSGPILEKGGGR